METVTVIICAYTEERWNDLLESVASVQQQTLPPTQIIVVIDHNPALLARARAHLRGVTLVPNGQTRGLSGARNSGIAVARGEIIAFLDEDAVAAPDWLARLVEEYADPAVMGAGGAIEPQWARHRPAWFPDEFNWVVGCTYRGMPETAAPVRNLIGCNMSFRREIFEVVGGFRHGIGRVGKRPVGCEETELCIRALQQWPGRQLRYQPRARVFHRVPSARASWGYFRARCYAEGLSKALVANFVGAADGLSSERTYTLRTLPAGVVEGVSATVTGRDPAGLARAATIVAGLLITTAGYLRGALPRLAPLTRARS